MDLSRIHQPTVRIELANPGDLTIEVTEKSTEERTPVTKHATIRVEKARIIEHSPYFRRMFSGHWAEGTTDTITLKEDNITGMQVWFRLFHDALSTLPYGSVSIADVWCIILASDKYEFDRKYLADWFRRWFNWKIAQKPVWPLTPVHIKCQLLFPCYSFNYARGFQFLTQSLAYDCRTHIEELNPTPYFQMHLPRRIIQQLNAARGRLRNVIHRNLFSKVATILESSTCKCKEGTVFYYLRELQRIHVWPLEEVLPKASISELIDRMSDFNAKNISPTTTILNAATNSPTHTRCLCRSDWRTVVQLAEKNTRDYFHGLCMDCMATTKNVRLTRDEDEDYWNHNRRQWSYDSPCRIQHGERSRYFSFMGQKEKLGKFDQPAEVLGKGQ